VFVISKLLKPKPKVKELLSILSRREREVFLLYAVGKKRKEIALQLNLGEESVKTYLSKAKKKVGFKNQIEAAELIENRQAHFFPNL